MLSIDPEKVFFILVKARQFDGKVAPDAPSPASDAADDQDMEVLQDYAEDATEQELQDAIAGLSDEELNEVLALAWIGRGDFDAEQWGDAVAEAEQIGNREEARALLDMPLVSEYLEEGLAALGYDPTAEAEGHL